MRVRKINHGNDDTDHKNNDETKEKHDPHSDKWQITDDFMNKQHKQLNGNRSKFGRFYDRYNNKANKFTIQSIQTQTNTINTKNKETAGTISWHG